MINAMLVLLVVLALLVPTLSFKTKESARRGSKTSPAETTHHHRSNANIKMY